MQTIRDAYARYQVMIDTHTADGLKVARDHQVTNVPMLVLETALPAKFEDAIKEALNTLPERPNVLNNIEDLPQRFAVMDNDVNAVKQLIVEKTAA
jgi:threonine synthase